MATQQDLEQELSNAVKEVQLLRDQMLARDMESMKLKVGNIEEELKPIKEAIIKFNFILYLTMGGGLVSLINLLGLFAVIALIAMQILKVTP